MEGQPEQTRPVVEALRAVGLARRDVRDLAAYLFDGVSQAVIARRTRESKSATGRRLRAAIDKLRAAGFPVEARPQRCSRPAYSPAGQKVRTVDPRCLSRLTTEAGAGLTPATWRRERRRDRAERPLVDSDAS